MAVKRKYGWLRDYASLLDYTESHPEIADMLSKIALKHRVKGSASPPQAPAKVDLRTTGFFPPVYDQEHLGSCTANAAVALLQYFEKKAKGVAPNPSRLFVYKVSRNLARVTGDTGSFMRNVMGALVLFGAPPEEFWPYDITKFDEEPPAFCYSFAANLKTLKYFKVSDSHLSAQAQLDKLKAYLAAGFPCIMGFTIYEPEITLACYNGGHIAFPTKNSAVDGGHAVVACGYDDDMVINGDKGAILIRNSWGVWNLSPDARIRAQDARQIGDFGYFWLSYKYFTEKPVNVDDIWTIVKQDWIDTGNFIHASDNSDLR